MTHPFTRLLLFFILIFITLFAVHDNSANSNDNKEQCNDISNKQPTKLTFPIINISPLLTNPTQSYWLSSPESQQTIQQLRQACEQWGFFLITHHNITNNQILEFKQTLQKFFHLPKSEKNKVKRTANNSRGWADDELTKQIQDLKEIFDFGHVLNSSLDDSHVLNHVMDGYNQWPDESTTTTSPDIQGFKRVAKSWYSSMEQLSWVILQALLTSFELSHSIPGGAHDLMISHFSNHTSFLRLNYYPEFPTSTPHHHLGISRHTDAGVLTVLWQDGPALQVYTGYKEDAQDGEWINVPYLDDSAFVVNIGDMFHVWTGGVCSAPEHRVLSSNTMGRERFSAPFFFNPAYDVDFKPILREKMPQQFKPIHWGEFRWKRFQGDYADVGKESQIEDWLIT
jgi:isopenicillin N synthase-like dioxygenase